MSQSINWFINSNKRRNDEKSIYRRKCSTAFGETNSSFQKEKFEYTFLSYQCVDTHELFTTTELDTANTMQIYNQYRTKYGIPFPDEIRSIRRKYGLSATKMSVILGFGENQYRLYENGDMPSLTNGRILKTIQVPAVFATFVEAAKNLLNTEEYDKIMLCIEELENESNTSKLIKQLIFTTDGRNQWNGYALPSMSKLKNTMLYFIEKFNGVFVTQMNKLLLCRLSCLQEQRIRIDRLSI